MAHDDRARLGAQGQRCELPSRELIFGGVPGRGDEEPSSKRRSAGIILLARKFHTAAQGRNQTTGKVMAAKRCSLV